MRSTLSLLQPAYPHSAVSVVIFAPPFGLPRFHSEEVFFVANVLRQGYVVRAL